MKCEMLVKTNAGDFMFGWQIWMCMSHAHMHSKGVSVGLDHSSLITYHLRHEKARGRSAWGVPSHRIDFSSMWSRTSHLSAQSINQSIRATGSTSPRCGRAPRTCSGPCICAYACTCGRGQWRALVVERIGGGIEASGTPRIGMNEHIILPVPAKC